MNFVSLIMHGMSAIAVHIETVAVRILISTCLLISFAIIGIIITSCIKLFTPFATPGWSTTIVIGCLIIITQAFFISLALVFIVLTYRSQRTITPALNFKEYILEIKHIPS